jgi:hypothetical protein
MSVPRYLCEGLRPVRRFDAGLNTFYCCLIITASKSPQQLLRMTHTMCKVRRLLQHTSDPLPWLHCSLLAKTLRRSHNSCLNAAARCRFVPWQQPLRNPIEIPLEKVTDGQLRVLENCAVIPLGMTEEAPRA